MRHLRLWILGAALGSFAAGMNVGFVVPGLFASPTEVSAETRHDLEYVERLAATYGLSADQQRRVRLVLQALHDEELAALRSAEAAMLPPAVQKQINDARSRVQQRIRAVLTDPQRARYDIDSTPQQNR